MVDIYDGKTIVSGDEGPQGPPGRAGVGISFSNGYHPGEVLNGAAVVYPLTVTGDASSFLSRTKPTATVVFIINKNTIRIGLATMDPLLCGPGPVFKGVVTLDTPSVDLARDDLVDWTAPGSVDATFSRGECTLGSAP